MESTILFLAGFFAGTSVLLGACVFALARLLRTVDAERMRWTNKALIREGQTKIFPDSLIEDKPLESKSQPTTFEIKSPFRQGLSNLKTKLHKDRRVGGNLPPEIQTNIVNAAAKLKAVS